MTKCGPTCATLEHLSVRANPREGAVAPTKTSAHRASLRDRNKLNTRRAIHDAALKLFAGQGYDATTTEQIADKAGVATRTFFRYFPTKEHVLYQGEADWIREFLDVYPAQPTTLSDLEAMRVTLVGLTPNVEKSRRSMQLYQRAVDSSPTLRGLEQVHYEQDAGILAQAIAARRGRRRVDEACVLFASVGLLAYRRAVELWLAGPANGSLGKVITQEFELLESQLTG
jgi:AcrR family transcriptional regulator